MLSCSFDDLRAGVSINSGKKIDGAVALVLTDLPYMFRSEDDRVNSEHDVITQGEMVDFEELVDDVFCDGGHAHIFCATRKISKWFSALSQMVMDVPDPSDRSGNKMIEEALFTVEKNPLVYIRSRGDYF